MRDEYLSLALLNYFRSADFDRLMGDGWNEDERYGEIAVKSVEAAFKVYGHDVDPSWFAHQFSEMFSRLVGAGAIIYEGDDYTEPFFRLDAAKKKQIVSQDIQSNNAYQRLEKLGSKADKAMRTALSKALREVEIDPEAQFSEPDTSDLKFAPASDRLVTLTHNQSNAVEVPLEELIKLVEPENLIGEEGGLRELVLGKLKAGRELIRVGVFSFQSLQLTLIIGLKMLVEKHKDTVISVAASKLLDLLFAELGID